MGLGIALQFRDALEFELGSGRLASITGRDGSIRHFWSGEMGPSTADPGQDPRGAPDIDPLWTILDTTPEGRGKDWYPKLSY